MYTLYSSLNKFLILATSCWGRKTTKTLSSTNKLTARSVGYLYLQRPCVGICTHQFEDSMERLFFGKHYYVSECSCKCQ